MKIYEILDSAVSGQIGILLYYEKSDVCIIELQDDLDEWTAPLLFTGLVKNHIYTIPEDISRMWVNERVIPSGRQNIGSILTTHKLKMYDEMKFLEISEGKCSQDSLYIRKTDVLPEYVQERMKKNLTECMVLQNNQLLCFFADDTTRKIDLTRQKQADAAGKLLKNPVLLHSGQVGTGGYSMDFGGSVKIPARVLYESGIPVPLSLSDFKDFIKNCLLDTSESCNLLQCSRQNLAYLQEKNLTPTKNTGKGTLYLKGELLRTSW